MAGPLAVYCDGICIFLETEQGLRLSVQAGDPARTTELVSLAVGLERKNILSSTVDSIVAFPSYSNASRCGRDVPPVRRLTQSMANIGIDWLSVTQGFGFLRARVVRSARR